MLYYKNQGHFFMEYDFFVIFFLMIVKVNAYLFFLLFAHDLHTFPVGNYCIKKVFQYINHKQHKTERRSYAHNRNFFR
jgi:hypothetical protein